MHYDNSGLQNKLRFCHIFPVEELVYFLAFYTLIAAGIRAYQPFGRMTFVAEQHINRLRWTRRVRRWQRRDWSIFTDESRFNLFQADGKVRVHRRRGEWMAAACVRSGVEFVVTRRRI